MHVDIQDVKAKEISEATSERILLPREKSETQQVEVKHWIVGPQGEVEIPSEERFEAAVYVLSGRGLMQGNRAATRGIILYTDMAVWFAKGGFVLSNSGEGEMRVLMISTKTDREHYKFTRPRMSYFWHAEFRLQAGYHARSFWKNEDLTTAGALRTHGLEVETLAPGYEAAPHTDPEEVLYVVRGEGEILSEGERRKVAAGTLCYQPAGTPHGIWNTSQLDNMEYLVMEFNEASKRYAPLMD